MASDLRSCLFDRDDEFLGCDKSSEVATSFRPRNGKAQGRTKEEENEKLAAADDDEDDDDDLWKQIAPLEMVHEGRAIVPHCLFVEVKSSNDTLDARQEDWLNVLDQHGYARVCKFATNQKSQRRGTNERTCGIAGGFYRLRRVRGSCRQQVFQRGGAPDNRTIGPSISHISFHLRPTSRHYIQKVRKRVIWFVYDDDFVLRRQPTEIWLTSHALHERRGLAETRAELRADVRG